MDQAALQGLQEHISDRGLREASARLARLLSLEDPEQQVQVGAGAGCWASTAAERARLLHAGTRPCWVASGMQLMHQPAKALPFQDGC